MSQYTRHKVADERMRRINIDDPSWKKHGIEIFQIKPYQYRFIRGGLMVDYYPQSGKYFDITHKIWGACPAYDVIKLLLERPIEK